MTSDWNDVEPPAKEASARERLRSGAVETPPPDNRRTRRAATMMFVLVFVGLPLVGITFIDRDDGTGRLFGILLLIYLAIMGFLIVKAIIRR